MGFQSFFSRLLRPFDDQKLPAILNEDYALADEPPITEADVEQCIASIRTAKPRPPEQTDFFLAIAQAEKFAFDCLEFGPEQTHHTRGVHLDTAFQVWAIRTMRYPPDAQTAKHAMRTILEWRGGHILIRNGFELYVGCKLNAKIVEMVNNTRRPLDVVARDLTATKAQH